MRPAARGIIKRIPEKPGKVHPVNLCQRDRLQRIARPKGPPPTFTYGTQASIRTDNLKTRISTVCSGFELGSRYLTISPLPNRLVVLIVTIIHPATTASNRHW